MRDSCERLVSPRSSGIYSVSDTGRELARICWRELLKHLQLFNDPVVILFQSGYRAEEISIVDTFIGLVLITRGEFLTITVPIYEAT